MNRVDLDFERPLLEKYYKDFLDDKVNFEFFFRRLKRSDKEYKMEYVKKFMQQRYNGKMMSKLYSLFSTDV